MKVEITSIEYHGRGLDTKIKLTLNQDNRYGKSTHDYENEVAKFHIGKAELTQEELTEK